jgi:hypothetical protein
MMAQFRNCQSFSLRPLPSSYPALLLSLCDRRDRDARQLCSRLSALAACWDGNCLLASAKMDKSFGERRDLFLTDLAYFLLKESNYEHLPMHPINSLLSKASDFSSQIGEVSQPPNETLDARSVPSPASIHFAESICLASHCHQKNGCNENLLYNIYSDLGRPGHQYCFFYFSYGNNRIQIVGYGKATGESFFS